MVIRREVVIRRKTMIRRKMMTEDEMGRAFDQKELISILLSLEIIGQKTVKVAWIGCQLYLQLRGIRTSQYWHRLMLANPINRLLIFPVMPT